MGSDRDGFPSAGSVLCWEPQLVLPQVSPGVQPCLVQLPGAVGGWEGPAEWGWGCPGCSEPLQQLPVGAAPAAILTHLCAQQLPWEQSSVQSMLKVVSGSTGLQQQN